MNDPNDILACPETAPLPADVVEAAVAALHLSERMELGTVEAIHTYLKRLPVEFLVVAWVAAIRRLDREGGMGGVDLLRTRAGREYAQLHLTLHINQKEINQ